MGTQAKIRKSKPVITSNHGVKVVKSCTIRKDAATLFQFWRKLENLPRFMKRVRSVTQSSPNESHWVVAGPGGKTIEWDATIINEHPNELIAWRSNEGSQIPNAGAVRFEPAATGEGTEVTIALEYKPPAGKLGSILARLAGNDPSREVEEDLRRFKALFEADDISRTSGESADISKGKT